MRSRADARGLIKNFNSRLGGLSLRDLHSEFSEFVTARRLGILEINPNSTLAIEYLRLDWVVECIHSPSPAVAVPFRIVSTCGSAATSKPMAIKIEAVTKWGILMLSPLKVDLETCGPNLC